MDDKLIRSAYRLRSRLLCLLGRHAWKTRRNPDVGGREAVYETCYRCGKERPQYGVRPPGSIIGG